MESGAKDNFCTAQVWRKLGKLMLQPARICYISATGDLLPVLGTSNAKASLDNPTWAREVMLNILSLPYLNLLSRTDIHLLRINVHALLQPGDNTCKDDVHSTLEESQPDQALSKACKQLFLEFPDLFKPELGCLKDYELEVAFKPDAKPVFCKPQTVLFAILEGLNTAYNASIGNGVWVPT